MNRAELILLAGEIAGEARKQADDAKPLSRSERMRAMLTFVLERNPRAALVWYFLTEGPIGDSDTDATFFGLSWDIADQADQWGERTPSLLQAAFVIVQTFFWVEETEKCWMLAQAAGILLKIHSDTK